MSYETTYFVLNNRCHGAMFLVMRLQDIMAIIYARMCLSGYPDITRNGLNRGRFYLIHSKVGLPSKTKTNGENCRKRENI